MLSSSFLRSASIDELAAHITSDFGLFVRVGDAWKILGYPSNEAARKAALRDRLPVGVIELPGRRGKYIRSLDLATWLFDALNKGTEPGIKNSTQSTVEDGH